VDDSTLLEILLPSMENNDDDVAEGRTSRNNIVAPSYHYEAVSSSPTVVVEVASGGGDDDGDVEEAQDAECDGLLADNEPYGEIVTAPAWSEWMHGTLLSDNGATLGGVQFLEGPFSVKLLKLLAFTWLGIVFVFHFVRWVDWEHDRQLELKDVWTYEGVVIAADVTVFYVIGRLYSAAGVDHLSFVFWCLAANLYSSWMTDFSFFRHSFTLYEMHCRWPWQLWLFVSLVTPLIVAIAVMHVWKCYKDGILVQKCAEMALCVIVFLLPYAPSPYFHLHHWYAGWLVGMHLNLNAWWSRAVQAWCWGCYINGIAVYGRDPVLTCGYALFMAQDQHCPFLTCYLEALADPEHRTQDNHTQAPMEPPDWRNCSSSYHP
jgi:hypothetical protein